MTEEAGPEPRPPAGEALDLISRALGSRPAARLWISVILRPALPLQVLEADRLEHDPIQQPAADRAEPLLRRRDDDALAAVELAGLLRRAHRRRTRDVLFDRLAAERTVVQERHPLDAEAVEQGDLLAEVQILAVDRQVEGAQGEAAVLHAVPRVLDAGAEQL